MTFTAIKSRETSADALSSLEAMSDQVLGNNSNHDSLKCKPNLYDTNIINSNTVEFFTPDCAKNLMRYEPNSNGPTCTVDYIDPGGSAFDVTQISFKGIADLCEGIDINNHKKARESAVLPCESEFRPSDCLTTASNYQTASVSVASTSIAHTTTLTPWTTSAVLPIITANSSRRHSPTLTLHATTYPSANAVISTPTYTMHSTSSSPSIQKVQSRSSKSSTNMELQASSFVYSTGSTQSTSQPSLPSAHLLPSTSFSSTISNSTLSSEGSKHVMNSTSSTSPAHVPYSMTNLISSESSTSISSSLPLITSAFSLNPMASTSKTPSVVVSLEQSKDDKISIMNNDSNNQDAINMDWSPSPADSTCSIASRANSTYRENFSDAHGCQGMYVCGQSNTSCVGTDVVSSPSAYCAHTSCMWSNSMYHEIASAINWIGKKLKSNKGNRERKTNYKNWLRKSVKNQ